MKKYLQYVGPVLVIGVFLIAGALLHRELRQYHMHDIKDAIEGIPAWRIGVAVALTVLNYLVLIGYDYLAVRAIRHPLPLGKIALASFTGFTTSTNFGAILGGTSVRYRLYSAWGMSAGEILQLVVMMGVTFWVGAFALAGVVFVVQPFPMPEKLELAVHQRASAGIYPVGRDGWLRDVDGDALAFAAGGRSPLQVPIHRHDHHATVRGCGRFDCGGRLPLHAGLARSGGRVLAVPGGVSAGGGGGDHHACAGRTGGV